MGDVPIGSPAEVPPAPRPADRSIADHARRHDGLYEPGLHVLLARERDIPDGNVRGYVEAHVRRLEALCRAGIVERLDPGCWGIPEDYEARALAYDQSRTRQRTLRLLSPIGIEAQVTAEAATWLDRRILDPAPSPISESGFGREVIEAMDRRRQWLVEQGLAQETETHWITRRDLLKVLARRELRQVGERLAREHLIPFHLPESGERISGTYRQSVNLVSGKYALVENAREFVLVPWRPMIERELGRQVSGLVRGDGISWEIGRGRGIGR